MPYWTQETASPDAELGLDDEDLPYLGLSTLYHPWPASAAPPVFVCRSKEVQIVRNHGNTYITVMQQPHLHGFARSLQRPILIATKTFDISVFRLYQFLRLPQLLFQFLSFALKR